MLIGVTTFVYKRDPLLPTMSKMVPTKKNKTAGIAALTQIALTLGCMLTKLKRRVSSLTGFVCLLIGSVCHGVLALWL